MHEPERYEDDIQVQVEGAQKGWRKIFIPVFFISFMIIFITSFGLSSFESLFSLFADRKFGFTPTDIAIMITGGGVLGAIFQVGLFGYLVKWLGEIKLIRYCLIFSGVLVFWMTLVHEYYAILLVTVTIFIGFDLMRDRKSTRLNSSHVSISY